MLYGIHNKENKVQVYLVQGIQNKRDNQNITETKHKEQLEQESTQQPSWVPGAMVVRNTVT